jgi:hypothetical protein
MTGCGPGSADERRGSKMSSTANPSITVASKATSMDSARIISADLGTTLQSCQQRPSLGASVESSEMYGLYVLHISPAGAKGVAESAGIDRR